MFRSGFSITSACVLVFALITQCLWAQPENSVAKMPHQERASQSPEPRSPAAPTATEGPRPASIRKEGDLTVFSPDLAKLQRAVEAVVTPFAHPEMEYKQIGVRDIQRFRYLVPERQVILVRVRYVAEWSKYNRYYIIVFRQNGLEFEPLLVYEGGNDYNIVEYETVDLDDAVPNPKMPDTWMRKEALLIEDHASGNQMASTLSLIFRYSAQADHFEEIFNLRTHFTTSATLGGLFGYDSKLEFVANSRDEPFPRLHDVVITTELVQDRYSNPSAPKREYEPIKTVFIWDGNGYVGKLKLPDAASGYQKVVDGRYLVLGK